MDLNRKEIEISIIDLHIRYFRQSKLRVIEFCKTSNLDLTGNLLNV